MRVRRVHRRLNISVVAQDGTEIYFRIRPHTQMGELMQAASRRLGVHRGSVRFLFDGDRLGDWHTAMDIGLQDGDSIDVMMMMVGD